MNEINIWGKRGCELPDGKLCNACCILPNIELEGVYVSVGKPANSPCPHLGQEAGCSLHTNGKPEACVSWHCSVTDISTKVDLIAQGLSSGLVTSGEAAEAAFKFLRGDISGVKEKIISRANYLSNMTHAKDLMHGDLDET